MQDVLPQIAAQKGLMVAIACGLVKCNSAGSARRRPPQRSTAQQTRSINRHSQVLRHHITSATLCMQIIVRILVQPLNTKIYLKN